VADVLRRLLQQRQCPDGQVAVFAMGLPLCTNRRSTRRQFYVVDVAAGP
jgi:hypothetical protein